MKFLLADENNLFRKYLIELITHNNDECVVVEDNKDVFSSYKKVKPDYVLINLRFKNNSGFRIAEELKKNNPAAVVAVISDFNDKRIKAKAEKIGADAFISMEDISKFFDELNKQKEKFSKTN